MRASQDILFGVAGQLLACDAPEGRPSSVTRVDVFRWSASDLAAPEFTPTGTVETNPATTTDAAAGADQADPKRVPLTATTGAQVGRTYLLASATQEREWLDVVEVSAADAVIARHPLHNTYASGSTFESTRMTATVDPTWIDDETNIDASSGASPMYRVRWVYVVGGVTCVQDTYFSLVRYAGRHGVAPQDVEELHAGWLDRLPVDHRTDQGRRLIDAAYREVRLDVRQIDFAAHALAETEVVDELVRYKTIALGEWARALSTDAADPARYALAKGAYTERLDALLRIVARVPVRNSDGSARNTTSVGLTVR